VIIPRRDDIIDFISFIAAEVNVVIGLADEFSMDGSFILELGESKQVNLFLPRWYFILGYLLYVLLYEVRLPSFGLAGSHIVVIEGCYLSALLLINKSSFSGSSGCSLLVNFLHALYML
jgi:hypothetical protein